MKLILLPLLILFLTMQVALFAQGDSSQILKVAFYNVENLFDPEDDSLKNDDSFTPTGFNHWTTKKMYRKINNIAKVILSMGGGDPPAIVAMAEIENRNVLQKLCRYSPLKSYDYKIVHYDSPDNRGIEVALIYRADKVLITHSEPVPIRFPFEPESKNRDVLYVVAKFSEEDSIHIFVNHWTSRYGGYAPTIVKRNYYASVVKRKSDSILQQNPNASILITGDFNDYPTDESIMEILQAKSPDELENDVHLFNLMLPFINQQNVGTHKREDFWGCLDQMIVTKALLDTVKTPYIIGGKATIFKADFMVEPDEKYGGYKVFRTYSGPRYIGGYADHLPVFVEMEVHNKRTILPRSP